MAAHLHGPLVDVQRLGQLGAHGHPSRLGALALHNAQLAAPEVHGELEELVDSHLVADFDAGVGRVVCAVLDPNPIAGSGLERLRAAGIEVEVGVLEAEAREVFDVTGAGDTVIALMSAALAGLFIAP